MNWIMHLHSRGSLVGEEVLRDSDLSDDEDLIPDQPSFVHLFHPPCSTRPRLLPGWTRPVRPQTLWQRGGDGRTFRFLYLQSWPLRWRKCPPLDYFSMWCNASGLHQYSALIQAFIQLGHRSDQGSPGAHNRSSSGGPYRSLHLDGTSRGDPPP